MRDNWINHNTDKLMLFILLLLGAYMVMHIVHHDQGDMQALTWAEGSFSTVLGALILILTGRIQSAHPPDGNGQPPQASPGGPAPTLRPVFPAGAQPQPGAGSQTVPKVANS
jgi:hypothetical protein